jgi:protein-L-isoaspartate(D-aspartate) O-methyltransferase
VAIDPDRQLFNGAPVYVMRLIDALGLRPGGRVLHVGAGLGYYAALMAHVVGPSGAVVALEVDDTLLGEARANLAPMPWVEVRREADPSRHAAFDAILVNTGVTHPDAAWLDGLAIGGRLIVPLTVAMPAMGHSLGKGIVVAIERSGADRFTAAMVSFIAIYSAVGFRDPVIEGKLGQAMRRTSFPNLTRLRRDAHESSEGCWLHGEHFCLSMEPV